MEKHTAQASAGAEVTTGQRARSSGSETTDAYSAMRLGTTA
jgi:hypothetical protein